MNRRRLQHYAMIIVLFGFTWGCTALPPCSVPQAPPPSSALPASVLQQRVKEQDKRIAELTTQLNMLKHLDQGRMKER
jgi:hypothetical protein